MKIRIRSVNYCKRDIDLIEPFYSDGWKLNIRQLYPIRNKANSFDGLMGHRTQWFDFIYIRPYPLVQSVSAKDIEDIENGPMDLREWK